MLNNLKRDEKGFTIIEVLIVLAIAGLIMLIVFLAIPSLQRSQRNNARRSDASMVASAISECLGNRNGSTDTTRGCGNTDNVDPGTLSRIEDFSHITTAPTGDYSQIEAQYLFGARCDAEGAGIDSSATNVSAREFVVLYQLEPDVNRCLAS